MAGLVPIEVVRRAVVRACTPLAPTDVPPARAVGCVTATAVTADEPVPPFANTAMDGYAVRSADTAGAPVRLEVVGTLAAGAAPSVSVGPGQAVRIMTGAPIPPGADAVVMVELTRPDDGGSGVVVEEAVAPGNHVRPEGDDLEPGAVVVAAGTALTPAHVGVLASVGRTSVTVHPRPRVGVLSTGDELVEGPAPLRPGQIRDANRPMLLALLQESGCDAVDLGVSADDEPSITAALEQGLSSCDALVTSGGVSVGDFDYVKTVLSRLGTFSSWQVAVKPAKPLAFAVAKDKPVFGLPGNPVSSVVSFELFARPALRRMMGHGDADLLRPELDAVADEPLRRAPDGKLHLVRVVASVVEGHLHVRSAGGQGSHVLSALAGANALALVPDGPGVDRGAVVRVMLLSDPVTPGLSLDPTWTPSL